jgi:murein hydrolase activator
VLRDVRAPDQLSAALLPLLLVAASARGAELTPQQQLEAVERQMAASRAEADVAAKQGAALAAEIGDLQAQSVSIAAAVEAREQALTAIEARIAGLGIEERARQADLERDAKREGALLTALVHVASAPQPAFLFGPVPPEDAVRGALVMGRTVPALDVEAARLKGEISRLGATRAALGAAQANADRERQGLAAAKARIADLIAAKTALQASTLESAEANRERVAVLAAQAGSLRDLIGRLGAAGKSGAAKPFADAKGLLTVPAAGAVVARFGTVDENGLPRQGITIETRPGAIVVAPYDGEIAFAGPFRGYGQILIISHGGGYHSLLAGLDRVDGTPGQRLVAGEPVGSMSEHAEKPRLYLEIRHDNQPIDPAPWLTTRLEKVNG